VKNRQRKPTKEEYLTNPRGDRPIENDEAIFVVLVSDLKDVTKNNFQKFFQFRNFAYLC
jgi:hypothetical protein